MNSYSWFNYLIRQCPICICRIFSWTKQISNWINYYCFFTYKYKNQPKRISFTSIWFITQNYHFVNNYISYKFYLVHYAYHLSLSMIVYCWWLGTFWYLPKMIWQNYMNLKSSKLWILQHINIFGTLFIIDNFLCPFYL